MDQYQKQVSRERLMALIETGDTRNVTEQDWTFWKDEFAASLRIAYNMGKTQAYANIIDDAKEHTKTVNQVLVYLGDNGGR